MARGLRKVGVRIVEAPAPTRGSSNVLPLDRVLSVVLESGYDVAWLWTATADGGSYVSGYKLVKRQ